jgi:HSP20 family protein
MAKKRKKVAKKAKTKVTKKAATPAPVTEPELLRPISSLRDQIEDVFDRYFSQWPDLWPHRGRLWDFDTDFGSKLFERAPSVDLSETDKGYQVSAELPGMDEKDIEISITGDMLTIKGEKREEREEDKKDYHLKERRYGKFHRSLRLPQDVNANNISAAFDKGVLSVQLPRRGSAKKKGRKISISKG